MRDEGDQLAYKKAREKDELREAQLRGRDEASLSLVDLVDDCDRAIDLMHASNDHSKILAGVEQLRRRSIQRFEEVGLRPFGEVGEQFDPHLHEAISTEPSLAPDGTILQVHRRGWQREDGRIVRTAMVTVCKGVPERREAKTQRRRVPVSDPVADAYICPFGYPGCRGDCPNCRLESAIESGHGRRST